MPSPDVRVLGPVEVIGAGGVPAALVGARQRAIVAALALHAGQVVPRWRLVETLWGDEPPRTAVKSLQSHVTRVRQALHACGHGDLLITREPGYGLAVPPEAVDAHRFQESIRSARADLAGGAVDRAAARLRAGLALWRGEALADAAAAGWGAAEADRLRELRLNAQEDLCDAQLQLGLHHATVDELERLAAANPFRERLVGLHLVALYRCGRQADALDTYRRIRARLADELGVDPGPELVRVHTAILRGELAAHPHPPRPPAGAAIPVPTPAQLPGRVGHFTGRAAELAALDRLLGADDEEPRLVAVTGLAGMGKTALAVEWAHRVAGRFPDGQLFLDLRGHDRAAAATGSEALSHLLRSLGVPDDRVPVELAERSALYRSLLAGKRMLIVLDNARAAEDIVPLVPGNGWSLVVVSSRGRLAALAARHPVHAVDLDVLSDDESTRLLARVVGAGRVGREPGPAARLGLLCGGMPLALRIAAARLTGQPGRPLADFAAELAGADPLATLSVEGDSRSVRTVFASAYRDLSAPAAGTFRLLGLHPGPTFTVQLAAAMAELTPAAARAAVAELAAAHLLAATADGHYRFHDLIRVFAHQCATVDETAERRVRAIERLLDWYLTVADAANRVLDRSRDMVVPALRHAAPVVPFASERPAALAFLDAEHGNLLPVVRHAAERGHDTAAWQLTYLLNSFTDARGHWGERVEICRRGVAAAERLGDPFAEGEMRRALGVAYRMTRRLTEALDSHDRALALMRAAGDKRGEGYVYNCIGGACTELRRFDEAAAAYQQSLALQTAAGSAIGVALAQRNLGYVQIRMGRADLGLGWLTKALATSRELDNPRIESGALDAIADAYLQLGDLDAALDYYGQAVAAAGRIGDRRAEADATNSIGAIRLVRGEHTAALTHFRAALQGSREIAELHLEAIILNHIGRTHLRTGNLAAAREHLDLALAVRGRVPDPYQEAHLHRDLADLDEAAGRRPAAAQHRDRAVQLYRAANARAEADAAMFTSTWPTTIEPEETDTILT